MKAQTVVLVGLDRVTASIGLTLREAGLGLKVIGHDPLLERAKAAERLGAVDEGRWSLAQAGAAADILVLSLDGKGREALLPAIAPSLREHVLIVDLSPGKTAGQALADACLSQGHYVGARPLPAVAYLLDGREDLEAAAANLFRDGLFCLSPAAGTEAKAVESAARFGLLLGARPYYLEPTELDRLVLAVDAVPGLLGAALFLAIQGAPGWRDMVRLAGAPFALATAAITDADIAAGALAEREATLRWLDAVLGALGEIRRRVSDGDRERLEATLQSMAAERERWLAERRRNEWEESMLGDARPLTMRERLLGSRGERDQ